MSSLGENLERNEEQKSKPPHQNKLFLAYSSSRAQIRASVYPQD